MAIFREFPLHLSQSSEYFLQHLSQRGVLSLFPRQFSLKSGCLRSFCGQVFLQLCNLFLCRHAPSVAALATLSVYHTWLDEDIHILALVTGEPLRLSGQDEIVYHA